MPAVQSSFPLEHFALPSLDDTFGAVLVGTFVGLVFVHFSMHVSPTWNRFSSFSGSTAVSFTSASTTSALIPKRGGH